jgi:quinolinate synthase
MTSMPIAFDYPQQNAAGATCTAQAWAKTPPQLHGADKAAVITRIKQLNEQERVVEIAKMLVGDKVTESALSNAKELMN